MSCLDLCFPIACHCHSVCGHFSPPFFCSSFTQGRAIVQLSQCTQLSPERCSQSWWVVPVMWPECWASWEICLCTLSHHTMYFDGIVEPLELVSRSQNQINQLNLGFILETDDKFKLCRRRWSGSLNALDHLIKRRKEGQIVCKNFRETHSNFPLCSSVFMLTQKMPPCNLGGCELRVCLVFFFASCDCYRDDALLLYTRTPLLGGHGMQPCCSETVSHSDSEGGGGGPLGGATGQQYRKNIRLGLVQKYDRCKPGLQHRSISALAAVDLLLQFLIESLCLGVHLFWNAQMKSLTWISLLFEDFHGWWD